MSVLKGALGLIWEYRLPLLRRILPWYVLLLCFLAVGTWLNQSAFATGITEGGVRGGFFTAFGSTGLLLLVYGLSAAALAVLWHRMVLNNDELPITWATWGRYLWAVILIALALLLVVGVPWMILQFTVGSLFMSRQNFEAVGLALYLLAAFFTFLGHLLWLRWGLTLPAAAYGDWELTMTDSIEATGDYAWPITVLAILLTAFQFVVPTVNASMVATLVVGELLFLIPTLIGLSALTWLYRETGVTPKAGANP